MTDSNIDAQDRQLLKARIPLFERHQPLRYLLKNNAMTNMLPTERLELVAAAARSKPYLDDETKLRLFDLTLQTFRKIANNHGNGPTQAAKQALQLIEQNNQYRDAQYRGGLKADKRMPLLATDAAVATFIEEITTPGAKPAVSPFSISFISVELKNYTQRRSGLVTNEPTSHERLIIIRNELSLADIPKFTGLKKTKASKPETGTETATPAADESATEEMSENTQSEQSVPPAEASVELPVSPEPTSLAPEEKTVAESMPSWMLNVDVTPSKEFKTPKQIMEIFMEGVPDRPRSRKAKKPKPPEIK